MTKATGGDVLDKERAEKLLYSGPSLPGGGQLEIRMEITAMTTASWIHGALSNSIRAP